MSGAEVNGAPRSFALSSILLAGGRGGAEAAAKAGTIADAEVEAEAEVGGTGFFLSVLALARYTGFVLRKVSVF